MKLYLSSYGLGKDPGILTAIVGENKKTAVIANARDGGDTIRRAEGVQREIVNLNNLGFKSEELDLRNYFDNADLKTKLSEYGLLWLLGGNSFTLRRAMKQSDFDNAAKELIISDQFVYAGYSAGACVATPNLHGIELVDDPNSVPDGYDSEIVWSGMNLVDFAIAPHYQSDHPESAAIEKVVGYFKEHDIPYRALHDGEVLLANNYEIKIV